MITPAEFTEAIRSTFGEYPTGSGGCKQFAELLQGLFGGELYCNNDHFIILIDGRFYDLRGNYGATDIVRYIFEGRLIELPVSDFLPAAIFGKPHIEGAFKSNAS